MNTSQQPARRPLLVALSMALAGTGCASLPGTDEIRTESFVDLDRFMGEWYVIASIPTAIEKNIFNATETYRLDNDGTINFADLQILKAALFSNPALPNWNADADLNGDGVINFADLQVMSDSFFGAPGPSGLVP